MAVILVIKILHVISAAIWFGHKALLPRDIRHSLHKRHEHQGLSVRMARAERVGIVAGLATLATGLGLVHLTTGFDATPLRIWIGLAGVLGILLVGGLVSSPAWREVRAGLEANDLPAAVARVGALVGGLRLEGLLWVLALTTMLL